MLDYLFVATHTWPLNTEDHRRQPSRGVVDVRAFRHLSALYNQIPLLTPAAFVVHLCCPGDLVYTNILIPTSLSLFPEPYKAVATT